MSLQTVIDADYKKAFKDNNRDAVSAYRMLKSAIKNQEIETGRELTDDENIAVISREVRRRREAMAQYERGGRIDLAAKEKFDVELYSKYLPAPLTDEELTAVVEQTIADVSAADPSAIGRVTGAVMKKVKGRADGKAVQAIVGQRLGEGSNKTH